MKRFFAVAASLAALIAAPCAFAAGTINLSLSQQFDTQGKPLSGCKLYFYSAGTTTPQSAYQDVGLTIAWPNPMTCDASGRIPQFFLADGSIKVRLADKNGNTIVAADNLLVIGPSSGGGGGGGVDATTVLATGDLKVKYGSGPISGFVRANGRTVGSATSGATERANADTQALFEYLWAADAILPVSGGRGASANADWLANKTIALPDARGRVIAGLDDMGSTSAARLNTIPSTTLGASGGGQTASLATSNLPAISYTPAGTLSITANDTGHTHGVTDAGHAHGVTDPGHLHALTTSYAFVPIGGGSVIAALVNSAGSANIGNSSSSPTGISINSAATGISIVGGQAVISASGTFTGTPANLGGSATAFNVLPPTILMTVYVKL